MADLYANELIKLERFKGDTFPVAFKFTYDDGVGIDLTECVAVLLTICPFGRYEDEAILTKKMVISDDDHSVATAYFTDTDFTGIDAMKVSYQPLLIHDVVEGEVTVRKVTRRGEGDIILYPDIKQDMSVI